MEIQKLLKAKRKAANLTQKEVAKKINVSQNYYSYLENGLCNPSLKVFSKIAAILDIDMNILKEGLNNEGR